MTQKKKRIVIALGGNALGNTLPEQMMAVKTTAKLLSISSKKVVKSSFLMETARKSA
ncbi:hypothetical protein LCQ47_07170 [Megasphaera massiliensis]|nr:hypothetical protein LCQ47_07170 [Megasphaera massiliensis]